MQQNLDVCLPPPTSGTYNTEITDEERVAVLTKSTKEVPMKIQRKKEFLLAIVRMKVDIEERTSVFDSLNNSSLENAIKLVLPRIKTVIKKSK